MRYFLIENNPSELKTILSFLKDIVAILAPIAAGYLGIKFGIRQFREQKKINLIEEQLNKFYSPMLGIRKEIRGKSELRAKIQHTSRKVWEKKSDRLTEKDFESTYSKIKYDNTQWEEELFPLYKEMLDIFRQNYWLATPETQEFYQPFLEFVELHNRWLKGGIDPDTVKDINSSEKNLEPFYVELENRTNILRKKILD